MILNSPKSSRQLNEIVEAFEASRVKDECDIQSFLPSKDSPDYRSIALELMRVDLEHCRRCGAPQPLEDYRNRFADILTDPDSFKELAFEEYRLRLLDGEAANPIEYRRYGIDTDDWPTEIEKGPDPADAPQRPLAELGHEVSRLVDAVQDFPEAGENFVGMQIIAQIGEGTFGRVYLARQSELSDRLVVLKVSSAGSVEPQRLARLQHTNIVPIYSVHSNELLSTICMPFFGVTTLSAVIKNLRSKDELPRSSHVIGESILAGQVDLPESEAIAVETISARFAENSYVDGCLALMGGIAAGLAHAVERGILHRDLKPANILLCDDGTPMLLDFNVSDDVIAGGHACLTAGGTLPYMSPEQLTAVLTGHPIDERSDIFSFGIILFELLTGQHPFPTSLQYDDCGHEMVSVFDIVEKSIEDRNETPNTIREKNPNIPRSIAGLVEKCIAPDPDQRYQTISELSEDIARHQANLPLKYAADRSPTERIKKWTCRHPRLSSFWGVVSIATIVCMVIGSMLLVRNAQLRRSEARGYLKSIRMELPIIRAYLTTPTVDAPSFDEGQRRGRDLLRVASGKKSEEFFAALPTEEAAELRTDLVDLSYLLAIAELKGAKTKGSRQFVDDALNWNRQAQSFCDESNALLVLAQQERHIAKFREAEQLPHSVITDETSLFHRDNYLAASHFAMQGEWSAAVPLLENLCRDEPHSFANHLLLGNAYASLERLSDAERSFSVCLALSPNSIHGYWHRGLTRLQSGEFQGAINDFDEFLERYPGWYAAYVNRALAHAGRKHMELAIEDLTSAIQIDPNRNWAYHLRSKYYIRMGKKDKAEEDRLMALKLEPQTADEWILRGLARQDDEQAIRDYRSALEVDPNSKPAKRNLANIHSEHKRDSASALEIIEELVIDNPKNATDLMSRAVLRARLNQTEGLVDARDSLDIRREPFDLYRAACAFALLSEDSVENTKEALKLLSEAFSLQPSWASLASRDQDLASLHKNPSFRRLVAASQRISAMKQSLKKE